MPDGHEKAMNLLAAGRLSRKIEIPQKEFALRAFREAIRIADISGDSFLSSLAYGYMGRIYEHAERNAEALTLTRRAIFYAHQKHIPEILYQWYWQLGRLFRSMGEIDEAVSAYQEAVSMLDDANGDSKTANAGKMDPILRQLMNDSRGLEDNFEQRIKPVFMELAQYLVELADIAPIGKKDARLIQAMEIMERLKAFELQNFYQDEDGIKRFWVGTSHAELRETAKRFRARLQTRSTNRFLYDARDLYDWLIRPAENALTEAGINTLIVVPGGPLRLIPFSALWDGRKFLVESYAVATLPALAMAEPEVFNARSAKMLLGGLSEKVILDKDSDHRIEFPALPNVPGELQAIKAIMGKKVRSELRDKQLVPEKLKRELNTDKAYSTVHIATHGVFGGTPAESYLLTHEGRLTMDELERLLGLNRFRDKPLELLTLSACQTAMGNEQAGLGLAGIAVKAGVQSVLATLWFVDDRATSLAIDEFYRELMTPGTSRAKALQNAQKKLIAEGHFRHPAYWAPFLLIGNWM